MAREIRRDVCQPVHYLFKWRFRLSLLFCNSAASLIERLTVQICWKWNTLSAKWIIISETVWRETNLEVPLVSKWCCLKGLWNTDTTGTLMMLVTRYNKVTNVITHFNISQMIPFDTMAFLFEPGTALVCGHWWFLMSYDETGLESKTQPFAALIEKRWFYRSSGSHKDTAVVNHSPYAATAIFTPHRVARDTQWPGLACGEHFLSEQEFLGFVVV